MAETCKENPTQLDSVKYIKYAQIMWLFKGVHALSPLL
jgi:hypothetical protein